LIGNYLLVCNPDWTPLLPETGFLIVAWAAVPHLFFYQDSARRLLIEINAPFPIAMVVSGALSPSVHQGLM
jgi:hypothetical protein